MNIQILDSWLKKYLKTKATAKEIAEKLSLTSVSIERVEKWKNDFLYDIEVTTNRPDLASVVGIAREASAVLPQAGVHAVFVPPLLTKPLIKQPTATIEIKNDPSLVNRICTVIMEVTMKDSPAEVKDRLESSGIRSLNNIVDITNYVMREIGHPTHVFDFDRLDTKALTIRQSKKGEKVKTLDNKTHTLLGGDIVAENDRGEIVDLLGVMGLENSVVTKETKRILFFVDNTEPHHIRKTSMGLGIRTEAAQLNEKSIDPELSYEALLLGIKLYQEFAQGKVLSNIIDIYPNKGASKTITVSEEKINKVIGVDVPLKKSVEILTKLGFATTTQGSNLTVTVPSFRADDMDIPEDVIEEVARVYGYHNIPSVLPSVAIQNFEPIADNPFYLERKVKQALKYWGYTEVYTYSMVSENLYDGPIDDAVAIQNPLNEEFVYMRSSLILSLLQVLNENKKREEIKLFEIANVYQKTATDLPTETRMLAGILKKPKASFYELKGIIEQLAKDLGINTLSFKPAEEITNGAYIIVGNKALGTIEVLDPSVVNFELNFDEFIKHASTRKVFTPLAKYPPVLEDISVTLPTDILTGDVIGKIYKQSALIKQVALMDTYKTNRTFHIIYQHAEKNLTSEDVAPIRLKIIQMLEDTFDGKVKE